MPTYNITQLKSATTLVDVVSYANTSTQGHMLGMAMIGVYFILLLLLKGFGLKNALAAASYVSLILSLLLSFGGFLNFNYVVGFIVMTGLATLWLYLDKG